METKKNNKPLSPQEIMQNYLAKAETKIKSMNMQNVAYSLFNGDESGKENRIMNADGDVQKLNEERREIQIKAERVKRQKFPKLGLGRYLCPNLIQTKQKSNKKTA